MYVKWGEDIGDSPDVVSSNFFHFHFKFLHSFMIVPEVFYTKQYSENMAKTATSES